MDDLLTFVSSAFEAGQAIIDGNDKRFSTVEVKLQSYLARAKDTLVQKQIAIPKPAKRPMRTIQDEDEEEESDSVVVPPERQSSGLRSSIDKVLRPTRTAKDKANQNMKEVPLNFKMRNDNNTVVIKTERLSSIASSRESIKENREPEDGNNTNKRKSPDEGIQSATESEAELGSGAPKRSNSVEYITAKTVEIEITSGDDCDKMPPPALPKKIVKKTRTKQKKQVEEPVPDPQPSGLRVTRSKIKQEKVSIDINTPLIAESETTLQADVDSTVSGGKKGSKKKYPMPILVKIEKTEEVAKKVSAPKVDSPSVYSGDATFDVPNPNETVTVGPAPVMNETVLISANPNATVTIEKNPHDSLMTEDNDDDDDSNEDVPLSALKTYKHLPPMPALKLKKNEVFNPYLASPVKQKVQAFEKHALQPTPTPEKYKASTSKFSTLKSGTPSKIALYSKATTPLSNTRSQKAVYCSSTGPITSSAPSGAKSSKSLKKMNSMSHESLEETKKLLSNNAANALIEEKRKQREEKMRQAQQLREQLEKEKRDQALKLQMEREEKYRKIRKEKEDKQRMEALKKKIAKEKQAKKFAEQRANEFAVPKPVDSLNESLHLKLQKQIMAEKAQHLKKEESKNTYSFDMLHTDDETDDESRPANKRPPAPKWSQKTHRKLAMGSQSYSNECVLDNLFSVQPIQVDLKAIFPNIDARKLVRNSSAIWRTPPKNYQTQF